MKKFLFSGVLILFAYYTQAQDITRSLQVNFQQFENDPQLKHATSSLYVINAKTGQIVFDKNSQIGLAPASTQKVITTVTAFELLGKDFRYKTEFGLSVKKRQQFLYINPSGDPTLGSWRWESTRENNVLGRVSQAIKKTGVKNITNILVNDRGWDYEQIPDGWIWQDIGNYYGAGACQLNWRENQFDVFLKSGKTIGDSVSIVATEPLLYSMKPVSKLSSAAAGSGDNAYIYLPAASIQPVIRGTIPVNEERFKISGTILRPSEEFKARLTELAKDHFKQSYAVAFISLGKQASDSVKIIHTEISPPLDSIIYWFNKKSINLYGEALLKTMAFLKEGEGATATGVKTLRNFWKEKGIDEDELNIRDGSGLSPLNRVTTHVQVEVLKFARTRDWYPSFYEALPEYNGMKMKSGTISGAKGFCGYQKAKDGNEYIFSFLVNNYNGPASSLVNKMYKVLDNLK